MLIDRVSAYRAATETAWNSIVRRADRTLMASTNDLSATAHRIARHTHAAVERADERLAMRIDRLLRIGPAATQLEDTGEAGGHGSCEGDDEGDASAIDQPRQQVAAEAVGAEPEARFGALHPERRQPLLHRQHPRR